MSSLGAATANDALSDPPLEETQVNLWRRATQSRVQPVMTGSQASPAFKRITRLAARSLGAPFSLASTLDEGGQIVFGSHGDFGGGREQSVPSSFCGLVQAGGAPMVIRDGRANQAVAEVATWREGWVAYLGVPVRNERGEVTASLCVLDRQPRIWRASDLDLLWDFAGLLESEMAEREAVQRLAGQVDPLDGIVKTLPVATYVYDVVAQRSALISDGARMLYGYGPETWAVNSRGPIMLMHPDDRDALVEHFGRIAADRSEGGQRFEYRVRQADGSWHWMMARNVAHERGSDGRPTNILGTSSDVTERRAADAALQLRETQVRHILEASGAGTWAWDAATNAESWDKVFRRQFGFSDDEPATFDAWVARIHPEERDGLLARVERMSVTPGDDRWDAEFRILLPDGEVRWMRGFGRAQRDAEGRITGITGVNFDVTEAHRARARVREGEARLRIAAEVAELGMMDIDYESGTAILDSRGAAMFGLKAGMPLPREAVHARFHPDDRDEIHRRIRESLGPGGSGSFTMEHRVVRPDGGLGWLHVRKQVTFAGSAEERRPASALLVAVDVTERRLAEERERLLSRELAHRSKNLLALVQAVARQTAASTAEDFLPRFEARLQALAASQDLLMKQVRGGVDLEALARQQLAHFQDLLERRISLDGPSIRLSASTAQTLGMALYEMSTNAGKHGALSGPGGQVELAWAQDDDRFSISWRERGGPQVQVPTRKGFGSVVIDRMLRDTLEARVRLEFAPEGFSWEMDCPIEQVIDDPGRPRHD